MRARGRTTRMLCCLIAASVMLLIGPAAKSFASTSVRFLHAVPGAPAAQLKVGDTAVGGAVAFGESTESVDVESGTVDLALSGNGGDALAEAQAELQDDASYTVVALSEGEQADFAVFREAPARGGKARFRAVNASPELGEPDVRLSDRVVAEKLAYKDATDYVSVRPGNHDVAFARPDGGDPVTERAGVNMAAGTTTTAVVVGSRGEEARVLVLSDGTVAPSEAPDTGLGGLAEDEGVPSWLIVLGAALAAGLLGVTAFVAAGRLRRRAG